MGRKSVKEGLILLDAEDMSVAFTSDAIDVLQMDYASIHLNWTTGGTPIGQLFVEARRGDDDTWVEVNFGEDLVVPQVAPDDTDKLNLVFQIMPFSHIRIRYEPDGVSPGTGTINAIMCKKVTGA